VVFFVETPKAIQHFFRFQFFNFPSVFKTRMSFLLESVKVCQRYFYFSLQTCFGLAECVENYQKLYREIRHGPAKVDAASSPHFFSRDEGVASAPAAKTHSFCDPSPSCAECRGNIRQGDRTSLGVGGAQRRPPVGRCPYSEYSHRGCAPVRIRWIATRNFAKNNAAGIASIPAAR